jgi:LysM repeat protein
MVALFVNLRPAGLPPSRLSAKIASMKRFALGSFTFLFAAMICATAPAQLPSGDRSDAARLDELARKIDLQNAKIDTLSRQILKLEQQISAQRPGVMIGETPTPATTDAAKPPPQTGNSHVVAKGETLTSIAKMHKVTVEELQKFNHIENDRKLQIGQTIMIPASAASSPTPVPPNG